MKKGTHKAGAEVEDRKSVWDPNRKRTNLRYRVEYEKRTGKKLKPGESMHHKNGNQKDDRPSNVKKTTAKPGSKAHKVKGKK